MQAKKVTLAEYLSVKEYAEKFRVHEDTVYRWIRRGDIIVLRVGKVIRIPPQRHPRQ